jgi:phosphoserine phosphatase
MITPSEKRTILLSLATKHNIPLAHTLAVGDGANDLEMLNAAGLGIAWRAKEKVQREAPQRLNGESLEELVMLLGPKGGHQNRGNKMGDF